MKQVPALMRRQVLGATAALAVGYKSSAAAIRHEPEVDMIQIRRANDRGHANHGWLDTNHTFSFAHYYDPKHMGHRSLRVINEDRIAPGAGFPTHPHRNMEIITYVLDGALEHKDSMGHGSVIRPGEVQLMSAGTGVTHSEYNHAGDDPLHLLQIWLVPNRTGTEPGYQQREFSKAERQGDWRLLVSPDGEDGSLIIKQDARLYGTLLETGKKVEKTISSGRGAWLHVARGSVELEGHELEAGDGVAIEEVDAIALVATSTADVLLFDLA